ncbi:MULTISPECIES: response regulator [unclassified Carboxylicivirga]|uniref:response regulator n=1 Tax=Carboxylicivirga TaxID=1628153 RepID=UPI003D348910
MNFSKHTLLVLFGIGLFFWGNFQSAFGKPLSKQFYTEQIAIEQGLSQNSVRTILRDAVGMLWIGTRNGLNRYDGTRMKCYHARETAPDGLPGNYIYFITEDDKGDIWVGTDKGMATYSRHNDTFHQVVTGRAQRDTVYSNVLVHNSKLIFGAGRHLALYDMVSRSFELLDFKGLNTGLPLFYQIFPWQGNTVLIISRWKGAYFCDLNSGQLSRVPFIAEDEIMAACIDNRDHLWISGYKKGVKVFDKQGQCLRHFTKTNSALQNDVILDITQVDNQLWMGTDGHGVQVYDLLTNRFSNIGNIAPFFHRLRLNTVSHIYCDTYGGLWLGTVNSGLFAIKQVSISAHTNAPFNSPLGLSSPAVLSLYEDEAGQVWVGTDGGGLNRYDSQTGRFQHYASTKGKKVNAIVSLDQGSLLLNCYLEGLKHFDIHSGKLSNYSVSIADTLSMPGQRYLGVSLLKDSNGTILLLENEVYRLDTQKRRFELLPRTTQLQGDGELKPAGTFQDASIFFSKKGIYNYDAEARRIDLLHKWAGTDDIQAAVCHNMDTVWVASSGTLCAYDMNTRQCEVLLSDTDRPINSLSGPVNDQLWMGLNGDLILYNTTLHTSMRYGASEGVFQNEYLVKSVLTTRNGDVYLGGVNGLVHIRKGYYQKSESPVELHLTQVEQNGQALSAKRYADLMATKKIDVPWHYTSFRFSLLIKSHDFFSDKRFRYKVGNKARPYVESYDTEFDLSFLPPGTYPVSVQTQLSNGDWSAPQELLLFTVMPPFWQRAWFIWAVVLIMALVSAAMLFFSEQRRKRKVQLALVQKDRAVNHQKLNFLVNISHELRTPLTLIAGPVEQLLKSDNLSASALNLLTLINRQVQHLKALTGQALSLGKMEQGDEKLSKKAVSLNSWLKTVVNEFVFELEKRNMQIAWQLDDRVENVMMDETACKKVVHNLMVNAFKYAGASATLSWSTRKLDEEVVEIAIGDEGMGLQPGDDTRVFERYRQGDAHNEGYGIGLSYARALIEMQGGVMGANNRPEGGARFYFTLPLTYCNSPEGTIMQTNSTDVLVANSKASENIKAVLSPLTLLVVDDNAEMTRYLKSIFAPYFKKIYLAGNGQEALRITEERQPDMIVSDVMMPVMDGIELCRRVKTTTSISHIPVVLLTARDEEGAVNKGYKMGADRYLTKPFSNDMLMDVVYNLLKRRQLLKEKYQTQQPHKPMDQKLVISNADEEFINNIGYSLIMRCKTD